MHNNTFSFIHQIGPICQTICFNSLLLFYPQVPFSGNGPETIKNNFPPKASISLGHFQHICWIVCIYAELCPKLCFLGDIELLLFLIYFYTPNHNTNPAVTTLHHFLNRFSKIIPQNMTVVEYVGSIWHRKRKKNLF